MTNVETYQEKLLPPNPRFPVLSLFRIWNDGDDVFDCMIYIQNGKRRIRLLLGKGSLQGYTKRKPLELGTMKKGENKFFWLEYCRDTDKARIITFKGFRKKGSVKDTISVEWDTSKTSVIHV